MVKKIAIEEYRLPSRPTIIQQINDYAAKIGYERKNGGFYTKDGKYAGSIYFVGREAGIDMLEYK